MSGSIGGELTSAIAMSLTAGMASIASWRSVRAVASIGAAHGYAFRAAELAYDLGQRHERERRARQRREGMRLALDTRG